MKKAALSLFAILALTTAAFAQDESESEGQEAVTPEAVAEQEAPVAEPAPEPAKEEKKKAVSVGTKEDRPLGIRAGVGYSGIASGYGSFNVGWHLGVWYDVIRIVDVQLGGDAFHLKMLFEPGLFATTRKSAIEGTQFWFELPITAAFSLSLLNDFRVKYAIGPYIGVGVTGEYSTEIYGVELSQSRFDIGHWHTIGIGYGKFAWLDFSVAAGFMDIVEVADKKVSGATPWSMKISGGWNF
jgi:hypothetical protein